MFVLRRIDNVGLMMDSLVQKIGEAVKKVAKRRGSEWWYTPHMAAASRAIADRLQLVDIVLEVRDARIPMSSESLQLREFSSLRRIILLNKMDLANQSQTKEWLRFFDNQGLVAFAVNSHNRDNIKELLNFLQIKVRELKTKDDPSHTITLMLVGVTNAGKSALANSLHQIGRISATEKGKSRHSVVSAQPGETKSITSFKIASHPNIYVLDTPGILPPYLSDHKTCSNLALSGAFKDTVVGEIQLAQYLLSIMNMSNEYKNWAKLCNASAGEEASLEGNNTHLKNISSKQFKSDHTQDLIVNDVRLALYHAVSSFTGSTGNEEDLAGLIQEEFKLLINAFHLPSQPEGCNYGVVATKLLNLYRTGRLGQYTLEHPPIYK